MGIEGWYYLHTNGSLLYKRELGDTAADIRESSFARGLWPMNPGDRENDWQILIEALSAGANSERIMELAAKWNCDDDDADVYAHHVGVLLKLDGGKWCATRGDFQDLQASPAGFGETKLEAMAELCSNLGYVPSKMWGAGFSDLLHDGADA